MCKPMREFMDELISCYNQDKSLYPLLCDFYENGEKYDWSDNYSEDDNIYLADYIDHGICQVFYENLNAPSQESRQKLSKLIRLSESHATTTHDVLFDILEYSAKKNNDLSVYGNK